MHEIFTNHLRDYELDGNPFRYRGIEYQMQNGFLTVIGITRRYCSTLVIPDYFTSTDYGEDSDYTEYNYVRDIAPAVFACKPIERVKLPCGLWRIGANAFAGCTSLRSVTFTGSKDIHIEENAFAGCIELQSVTGRGRVTVETNAFLACLSLSVFTLQVADMFAEAFYGCNKLTQICLADDARLHRQALCNSGINIMHVRDKLVLANDVVEHIQHENILLEVLHSATALNHLQDFNIKIVFDSRIINWFIKSIPSKIHDYFYNCTALIAE